MHILLPTPKQIYKYIQWKNKRKGGGEEGRREKGRGGEVWGGKGEGEKHYFIITFFFFLIGRKMPAKKFYLFTDKFSPGGNLYHLITGGFPRHKNIL